jgi:hypothetical protein
LSCSRRSPRARPETSARMPALIAARSARQKVFRATSHGGLWRTCCFDDELPRVLRSRVDPFCLCHTTCCAVSFAIELEGWPPAVVGHVPGNREHAARPARRLRGSDLQALMQHGRRGQRFCVAVHDLAGTQRSKNPIAPSLTSPMVPGTPAGPAPHADAVLPLKMHHNIFIAPMHNHQ